MPIPDSTNFENYEGRTLEMEIEEITTVKVLWHLVRLKGVGLKPNQPGIVFIPMWRDQDLVKSSEMTPQTTFVVEKHVR